MNRPITSHYSPLTMFRSQHYLILIALALGFFALPQRTQAISPPRMEAIPGRTQRRAKVPFCISRAALTTRPLVGPH